jgi:hypothetical protein
VEGQQTVEECKRNLHERLDWAMAERDDAAVAGAIERGEEVDGIYSLEEAGLLDGFFHWLEEMGILGKLQQVSMDGVKRVLYVGFALVLLYFLKTLFGVESMNSLPSLLFSCTAAMTLVGFNARQIAEGATRRGDDKRKNKAKQGPLSPQTLGKYICKIPLQTMADCYNGCILCLAGAGMFPALVGVIMDGSDLVTTEKYKGCGKRKREEKFKDKEGQWRVREVIEFGWKVLVVLEARTRIPIAVKVVEIQESECNYTLEMLEMAQANLGSSSRIVKVVFDRGYLDGETLYEMDRRGLIFVIPARSDMQITGAARGLAFTDCGRRAERVVEVRRGHGKKSWRERLRTRVVGLPGLTSYAQYGPAGADKGQYRKDFVGNRINGVVVLEWENKVHGRDKAPVFLTNAPVEDPFGPFDDYDGRSVIENVAFREGKQGWHLEHAPQKTAEGVTIHVYFTLLVMALTTAYRLWCRRQVVQEEGEEALADLEAAGAWIEPSGIRVFRRKVQQKNRDLVIIFWQGKYGIFSLVQLAGLVGLRVKPPEEGGPPRPGRRPGGGGGAWRMSAGGAGGAGAPR